MPEIMNLENTPTRIGDKKIMFSWALTFLIVALIAAVLGFGGIAGAAAGVAKFIFFAAIVLLLISLVTGGLRGKV